MQNFSEKFVCIIIKTPVHFKQKRILKSCADCFLVSLVFYNKSYE